jgi:hypothetical protein
MKKAHVWLGLCLLLGLAALADTPRAQTAPGDDVMAGKGLEVAPGDFMNALNVEDYAAVLDTFASWTRNSVVLAQERLNDSIEKGSFTESDLKEMTGKLDPSGSLGLKTLDDLKAAKPGVVMALKSLLSLTVTSEYRKKKRENWYVVRHNVGLFDGFSRLKPWIGVIRYEDKDGDYAEFALALEKHKWRITEFTLEVNGSSASLEAGVGVWGVLTGRQKVRILEGKQLLGSARDFCRVEYSKTGEQDQVSSPFKKEVGSETFKGKFYEVDRYIADLPNSSYDAAVIATPVEDSDPYLVMTFEWMSGKSDIQQFTDKAALDKAIAGWTEKPKEIPEGK